MEAYRFEVDALGQAMAGGVGVWVFRGVTFDLAAGERLLLLGANGAGKSSLLRCLAGVHKPTEGIYRHKGGRGRTGWLTAHTSHHLFLPAVREDLLFSPLNRGEDEGEWLPRLEQVGEALGLKALWHRPAQKLSQGERQRAAVGAMLMDQPDLLLLDEPSLGLDTPSRRELAGLIKKMESMALVLATHDLDWGRGLCDRFMVLYRGAVVAQGGIHELEDLREDDLLRWGLR